MWLTIEACLSGLKIINHCTALVLNTVPKDMCNLPFVQEKWKGTSQLEGIGSWIMLLNIKRKASCLFRVYLLNINAIKFKSVVRTSDLYLIKLFL
jgi:hypothetical protein